MLYYTPSPNVKIKIENVKGVYFLYYFYQDNELFLYG